MPEIIIDNEKCIKCGACIKDCITYSLEYDENNNIKFTNTNCISCQHCFAVCPTGAIKLDNLESAESPNYGNPEEILSLIKSRKSIRQFKQNEICNEDLQKIKEMLPYIPTGCNYNSLHFSFIESKSVMDKIREYTYQKLLKLLSNRFTAGYAGKFVKFKQAFENNEDIIYRNAPNMIVVSSSIKAPCANIDPIIALSYIELYAQSLGIGTCWCGFAQMCFKIFPKLSSVVKIPDGYKPVYVMLLGYPNVKYHRTTIPQEFSMSEIKEFESPELKILQKLKRLFLNFIR